MNEYESIMTKHGLRRTAQRRAVFVALKQASNPLKLSEILEQCRGIDRSSLYRTIDVFMKIGVVKIVHIGWKKKYELTEFFRPHHHHFRCTLCQGMLPITDSVLEDAIEEISRTHGFAPTSHHFEIEGVCRNCQTSHA